MKRLFRNAVTIPCIAWLMSVAPVVSAQVSPDSILYYEPIDIVFAQDADIEDASQQGSSASAQISAFGRRFLARLTQNRALIRSLPPETRAAVSDVVVWQGTLDSSPASWIRLVQRGAFTSGSFSDGIAIYRIEPFDDALPRLLAPNPLDAGKLIAYEQPATISAFGDLVVAESETESISTFFKNDLPEAAQKPVLVDGLEVEIAVVADAEFAASFDEHAAARVISAVNEADELFVQQIGLHLAITQLQIFESEPDPFEATEPRDLLQELEDFASSTPPFQQADLSHLFTRRSLGMNGETTTVGIARLGGVCEPGRGVAISGSPSGNITGHEIAHNFGVPHDGEAGSDCENEDSGFLMDPRVNGSGTFSDCSVGILLDAISSASCLSSIPESDLVLSIANAPAEVFGNSHFRVDLNLDSVGAHDSLVIELSIDSPSATINQIRWPSDGFANIDCDTDSVPALCTLHKLAANGRLPFEIFLNATEAGNISVDFDAWSLNDGDSGNNDASATINVLPAIDLRVTNVTVSPELAVPRQLVTISMDISNRGVADATEVEIEITPHWRHFEFVSADLPGGAGCTLTGSFLTCPVGGIPMGATQRVSFVLRALDNVPTGIERSGTSFDVSLSAVEPDTGDRFANAPLTIIDSNTDVSLTMAGPRTIEAGEEVTFSLRVDNLGPETADGMELTFVNPGMEIFFLGLGGCTISGDRTEVRCPVPMLHAGESDQFTIGGPARIVGTHFAEASLTVAASEPDEANNRAVLEWTVTAAGTSTPASGGGGGGGGGSMSPLGVLMMALASFAWRVRRRALRELSSKNRGRMPLPRGYGSTSAANRSSSGSVSSRTSRWRRLRRSESGSFS